MPPAPAPPSDVRLGGRLGAEFLGTFGLVFGGCGSAVLAAKFLNDDDVQLGIGFVGVALAFGLTVLTGAYAFGHVSGGHFNPAVTIGLAVANALRVARGPALRRHPDRRRLRRRRRALRHRHRQARHHRRRASWPPASPPTGTARNSPGGYGLGAALLTEIVLTAAFLYVILGATDDRAHKAFAPIAIGLALTLIHLISIPVTNTSVNPARSLGVAWYVGGAGAEPGLALHRRPDHRRRDRRRVLRPDHRRRSAAPAACEIADDEETVAHARRP